VRLPGYRVDALTDAAISYVDSHKHEPFCLFLSFLETMLLDVEEDPDQKQPIDDEAIEKRMTRLLIDSMKETEAPPEHFVRLGLESE
jgi:hypothetical protein